VDVAGKNILVTGSNTGIGRITAETLARRGARVFLANRSEDKTRPVLEGIRAAGGKADFLALDLADFAKVRKAAEAFLALDLPLHVLVNNAGLAGPRGFTADGFELTFGTNHLGPYLFTRLILPAIERAASEAGEARIVNVASRGHFRAKEGIDLGAVKNPTSLTGFPEYCVSKLANVLFTKELARRLPPNVTTYTLHPGAVATDVWREVPWGLRHFMKLFMLTEEQGAQTQIWCATADELRGQTGRYYDDRREKRPSRWADDEALARRLWDQSAEWVGLPA
jgi:NAD(P)-dependent dehydrogenase (short-subunit alcohol dehydrogenase family)